MNCAEFRALRAQLSYSAMVTRLPVVEAEIMRLEAVIQPVIKAMREATSKHERDKVYARLEEEEDWKLQALCFERDAIRKGLAE